jgi:hypothetical protein
MLLLITHFSPKNADGKCPSNHPLNTPVTKLTLECHTETVPVSATVVRRRYVTLTFPTAPWLRTAQLPPRCLGSSDIRHSRISFAENASSCV